MKKICIILTIITFTLSIVVLPCSAQKTAADILRASLLGAGAGAIGGVASGAKGRDVWKGALAGIGVNIVGGALLDSINRAPTQYRAPVQDRTPITQTRPPYTNSTNDTNNTAYQEGFFAGYKAGYTQGLKDGIRENTL